MKALKKYSFFMAMVLLLPSPSQADGNLLLEHCLVAEKYIDSQVLKNELSFGRCIGLVQGVRQTMQLMASDSPVKACFPKKGIENGQAIRIVTSYLRKNPEKLHKDEVFLVMSAFIVAYPCK